MPVGQSHQMNRVLFLQISTLRILMGDCWTCGSNVMWLTGIWLQMKVFRNCQSSPFPKVLNITICAWHVWNKCSVMMRMMRRKSSLLREWAANGRFDAANTCWHWTLYIAKYYSTHHHSQCQHMLALAHAGVGRNTRVRANPPTTP